MDINWKEKDERKRLSCYQFIVQHRNILQNDVNSEKLLTNFDKDNVGIEYISSDDENMPDNHKKTS